MTKKPIKLNKANITKLGKLSENANSPNLLIYEPLNWF